MGVMDFIVRRLIDSLNDFRCRRPSLGAKRCKPFALSLRPWART